nr:MAG TPA: hypothetical protein [Caudoviricetes sp.]
MNQALRADNTGFDPSLLAQANASPQEQVADRTLTLTSHKQITRANLRHESDTI